MSTDDLKNKAEGALGQAKEAAGNATGNDKLADEGRADQTKADLKDKVNDVKDAASDAANKILGDAQK